MLNLENLKRGDAIVYIKGEECKGYSVYETPASCIVLAPVSDNGGWVKGLLVESRKDGKILAVPADSQASLYEWGTIFAFRGECLIKQTRQAHKGAGMIYTGIDKHDGEMKVFARVKADIADFELSS